MKPEDALCRLRASWKKLINAVVSLWRMLHTIISSVALFLHKQMR